MLNLKLSLLVVLALAVGPLMASIEKEPVKVTHRNSGPRYDFDDVERTRLNQAAASSSPDANEVMQPSQQPASSPNAGGASDEPPTVGRISIGRIFLVPMMPHHQEREYGAGGGGDMWTSAARNRDNGGDDASERAPMNPFGMGAQRPSFWPFMAPPTRHHQHLFGADDASRSPSAEASEDRPRNSNAGEREEPSLSSQSARPAIDPIQMLVDLMQQALQTSRMPQPTSGGGGNNFFGDLNKEASASDQSANRQSGSELINKPQSNNETREDVVEIEGKKFLRKLIINRHQGENIVFMTKRLIFIPLNETESSSETPMMPSSSTSTSTTTPSSTAEPDKVETSAPAIISEQPRDKIKPEADEATTTTSTVASTTVSTTESAPVEPVSSSEVPVISTSERPATTESGPTGSELTTQKESWVRKLSDSIERTAERLVESVQASSTTEKPVETPKAN